MRSEAEADQVMFDRLQDDLRKATTVHDKMTRIHSERDADLEHYRLLVNGLLERWQAVFAQIELRLRELDLLGRHMNSYRDSYEWLIRWLTEARQRQEKIQAVPISDSRALREQLTDEKVRVMGGWCSSAAIWWSSLTYATGLMFLQKLLGEIEKNKDKIDDCHKNAKAYIDSVKV